MARRDGFNIRLKNFPGARRVTTEHGRMWVFDGKFFATKREIYDYVHPAPVKLPQEQPAVVLDENAATENVAEGLTGNPA